MAGIVKYRGDTTKRGPSPNVWHKCPIYPGFLHDPDSGWGFFDDFLRGQITPSITTLVDVNGYTMFGSSGATMTFDDALGGGVILTEATDNESISMSTEQHPYRITSGGGSFWFEARIKTSTITTGEQAWLVGLMDTTAQTAAVPITATGTIADMNFVGFHHQEANTTAFDASYKADSVTAVEVNSDIGTLVVDTYVKLGMWFDTSTNKLRFYVDNVEQASTKTIPNATGTDFPADIGLAPVLAMTLANSAAETVTMDWWQMFQAA